MKILWLESPCHSHVVSRLSAIHWAPFYPLPRGMLSMVLYTAGLRWWVVLLATTCAHSSPGETGTRECVIPIHVYIHEQGRELT